MSVLHACKSVYHMMSAAHKIQKTMLYPPGTGVIDDYVPSHVC